MVRSCFVVSRSELVRLVGTPLMQLKYATRLLIYWGQERKRSHTRRYHHVDVALDRHEKGVETTDRANSRGRERVLRDEQR